MAYVLDNYWQNSYVYEDVTIDWGTYEIFIPRQTLLLLQSNPIEVRQLNLADFRTALRLLEESSLGMPEPVILDYAAPTDVGGVTLAAVYIIREPYTVTFEDGQYAVNIVGGNTNIADRVNINNVGIRTTNSAGLQDLSALQAASFNGGVAVDVTTSYAGTTFPIGTRGFPVNNIADAKAIATSRGINTFFIMRSMTLATEVFTQGFVFLGDNPATVTMTIADAAGVDNCVFDNLTVQGVLDNYNLIDHCRILNLTHINGIIRNSWFDGVITLDGLGEAEIVNCRSGVVGVGLYPNINWAVGATTDLIIRDYSGGLGLNSCTDASVVSSIDFNSGDLHIAATMTAGHHTVRGVCNVYTAVGVTANIADNTLTNIVATSSGDTGAIAAAVWTDLTGAQVSTGVSNITNTLTAQDIIIGAINSTVGENQADITNMQVDVTSIKGTGEANNALLVNVDGDVAAVAAQTTTIQSNVSSNTISLSGLTTNVGTLQTSVNAIPTSADYSSILTSVSGVKTVVDANTITLGTVNTNTGDTNTKVTSIQGTVGTINASVGGDSANITSIKGTVEANNLALSNLDADVFLIDADINTIQGSIATLTTNVANVDADVAAVQSDLTAASLTLSGVDTKVTNLNTTVSANTVSVDAATAAVGNLQVIANSHTGKLDTIDATVDGIDAAMLAEAGRSSAIQSVLNTVNTTVDRIEVDTTTHITAINTVNTLVGNNTTAINGVNSNVLAQNAAIATIDTVVDTNNNKLDTLTSKIDVVDGIVDNIQTTVGLTSSAVTGVSTKVDGVTTKVDSVIATQTTHTGLINTVDTVADQLITNVAAVQFSIDNYVHDFSTITNAIDAQTATLTVSLNGIVSDISTSYANNVTRFDTVDAAVTILDSRLSEVWNQFGLNPLDPVNYQVAAVWNYTI